MGNQRAAALGFILSRTSLMFGGKEIEGERLNKLEGRLDRGKVGFEDERELSMLAGGQEKESMRPRRHPRESSKKHSWGEAVEVGIRNSGRDYLGKSSLGKFRSEKEGR